MDSDLVVAKVGSLAAKHVEVVDLLPIGVAAIDVPNNAPLVWHLLASEESCPPAQDASPATQKVEVAEDHHLYIHSNCLDPCHQEEALLVCTFPSAEEHPALEAIQPQVLHMVEVVADPAIPCMPHLVACVPLVAAVLRRVAVERDVVPHMAVFGGIQEVGHSYFLAFRCRLKWFRL